jgi:hypothetical protein
MDIQFTKGKGLQSVVSVCEAKDRPLKTWKKVEYPSLLIISQRRCSVFPRNEARDDT